MAAGSTYTPIATTTLGSNAASYTFNSIPSTYTDLIIVVYGTATGSGSNAYVQYNGDTGSNYSNIYVYGSGTSAISGTNTSQTQANFGYVNATYGTSICQIQNYANTTTYKTYLARWNNTDVLVAASVSLWRSTAAITSILVGCGSGNSFITGTSITLYGIKAA
jgi:hypothetical protein